MGSRILLVCASIFVTGCTSLLPPEPTAAPSPRCRALDARFRTFGVLARLGGAGAVASGLGSAATDDTPRLVFGASALSFGVLAATAGLVQSRTAAAYVNECTENRARDEARVR